MHRCSAIITDISTHKQRKCKKNCNFIIQNCKYCYIHANINYKQHIYKIQALFRGYKVRRKIKYLKLMPCDIQSKIISIIKEEHSLIKYNQRLSNFLLKKIKNEISLFTNNYLWKSRFHLQQTIVLHDYFIKVFKMIILYKKYKKIIRINPEFKKTLFTNYYFDYYDIPYFIHMLTVCLINIFNREDEFFKQDLIQKGINFHNFINTIIYKK